MLTKEISQLQLFCPYKDASAKYYERYILFQHHRISTEFAEKIVLFGDLFITMVCNSG